MIFDSWAHPLMMGLEEYLIGMFRHDFEFVDGHRSHLGDGASSVRPAADPVHGGVATAATATPEAPPSGQATATAPALAADGEPHWSPDGEAELHKIPFFVRGKVRRNTELFARERNIGQISSETLYDAKAHFSR